MDKFFCYEKYILPEWIKNSDQNTKTRVKIRQRIGASPKLIQKTNYYRSKKMMELVRTLPCANCGAEDGTVCGAHANWSWANKGRGIKADDLVAALCHKCHTQLDQGRDLNRDQRELMWLKSFYKTIEMAIKSGIIEIAQK